MIEDGTATHQCQADIPDCISACRGGQNLIPSGDGWHPQTHPPTTHREPLFRQAHVGVFGAQVKVFSEPLLVVDHDR